MTILAGGNVGIGTTNPAQPLVVSNGGAAGFEWVPSTGRWYRYNRSTAAYAGIYTEASEHTWSIGASEAMRINSSGNLLIGTTTDSGFKFEAIGTGRFSQTTAIPLTVQRTTANSNVGIRYQNNTTSWYSGLAADDSFSVSFNDANLSAGQFKVATTGAATFTSSVTATSFNGATNNILSVGGTERMRITSAGNVGIGTTTPSHKFNVVTDAVAGRQNLAAIDRTSGNLITFTNPQYSVDASMGLMLRVFPQSDSRQGAGIIASGGGLNGETDLSLFVSSGIGSSVSYGALNIKGNTGNVGIGTTSPGSLLQLYKANADAEIISERSDAGTGARYVLSAIVGGSTRWRFATIDTNSFATFVNGSERMRITSTGNVGIGTTTPGASIHVAGAINSVPTGDGFLAGIQSGYAIIHLNGSAATGSIIDFSVSGTDTKGRILYDNTNNYFGFNTNGSERLRITSTGDVGIGTTSPSAKLHVIGNVTVSATLSTANAKISGTLADSFNQVGTAGQVLSSTGTGVEWVTGGGGGGGSTIIVKDEGTTIGSSFTTLDFYGINIQASASGSTAVITTLNNAGTGSNFANASTSNFAPGSTWSDIEIDGSILILASAPDAATGSSKLIATVTFGVENVSLYEGFNNFEFRLYNVNSSSPITDTTHTWTGFMSKFEGATRTVFTFHIPLKDEVTPGDEIRVQVQQGVSYTPEIYFCSMTLLEGTD
jgi:hypothetical protein